MPSLRKDTVRKLLIQRINSVTAGVHPRWGKMDAAKMLCHLGDTLAMALGELPTKSANRKLFQSFPVKHLFLYVLPMPKNVPTAPELLKGIPGNLESDRQRIVEKIERLATAPQDLGPDHPFFGPLTNDQWNSLQWKHIDHHLRQFGL
jgi:hypothetical protein